ncbi:hypothetical protein SCH4B_3254 [Ruegeria sp. TrichCH4B]|nr:hypothetical protein SCH4B_3254 [Ruegeria sp. TrichCH4B]
MSTSGAVGRLSPLQLFSNISEREAEPRIPDQTSAPQALRWITRFL